MPKSVEWHDTYLIGIPELDGEHRDLVTAIGEIMDRAQAGEAMSGLARSLTTFVDTFAAHAEKEAAFLGRLCQPEGVAHRTHHLAGHDAFLIKARALRDQFLAGDGCPTQIDRLGVLLTLFELIQADYDMAGHLKREGLLTIDGAACPQD